VEAPWRLGSENPTPHRLYCINCSRCVRDGAELQRGGHTPLRPSFAPPPLLWAWIAVLVWAWPNSVPSWPSSSSPSSALSRKRTFLRCSACLCPCFCISVIRGHNWKQGIITCVCVLMFIPSFLVECWR
jgi:hypothetical protein